MTAIKPRRTRWARLVAKMAEIINAFTAAVGRENLGEVGIDKRIKLK
jgi:hypothetical protein